MKYKNYKSAIHNFAHSFQSLDYMKSPKQSFNVLVELANLGLEPKATFDFLKGTIEPNEAISDSSKQLLNDYMDWLPEHCLKHNCDPENLMRLEITIWTNFNNPTTSEHNKNHLILSIHTNTNWQVKGKEEQQIDITELEGIDRRNLLKKMPEF
ncbi:hypothetical protein N6H18_03655 [Reichenbachiella agarivorans]|uniref:Uncharacterized protein n=1 Tax=Reichenbachiella agarivorans TaxID=2979464 RepID=A0ABY6CRB8_9BACT|nr:hypothetical protein [Reichenbachiella agarivorans]UXP33052.1 hypothetical protein N6H18_03655 [Reichenbachiella agarivorans]